MFKLPAPIVGSSTFGSSKSTPRRRNNALYSLSTGEPTASSSFDLAARTLNGHSQPYRSRVMASPPDRSSSSYHTTNMANGFEASSNGEESEDSESGEPDMASYAPELIRDTRTGEVITGTVAGLLPLLFPTVDYCPDAQLIFALLLNLRSYIPPAEILQKLLQHCMYEQNAGLSGGNFRRENRWRLFENVFSVCDEWVRQLPYDFRSAAMRDRLMEIFGLCRVDSATQRKCDELVLDLRSVLSKAERYANAVGNLQRPVEDPPKQSDHPTGMIAVCGSAAIVAQQLAHIELERLSMIGADELIDMVANSTSIESLGRAAPTEAVVDVVENGNGPQPGMTNNGQPKLTTKSNIRHYVEWFNQLTALVATDVMRHRRRRHRALVLDYWIDVARECHNVGNFNSLMAIIAALSLHSLTRLRRAWQRAERKGQWEVLQKQLDPSGNFQNYRSTLKAAIWREEQGRQQQPGQRDMVIPFFGLLMKDLFLLHRQASRPMANQGHLNWVAMRDFARHMADLQRWKTKTCPFKKSSPTLQYLLLGADYDERNLLLLSYEYDYPDTAPDREQYKKLTSDSDPAQ